MSSSEGRVDGKEGGFSHVPADAKKVTVHLRHVGNAPVLKKKKFKAGARNTIAFVLRFLRKQLKLRAEDALFLYCNSAFAPSPEESLYDLFECFSVDGELILNYSITPAFG